MNNKLAANISCSDHITHCTVNAFMGGYGKECRSKVAHARKQKLEICKLLWWHHCNERHQKFNLQIFCSFIFHALILFEWQIAFLCFIPFFKSNILIFRPVNIDIERFVQCSLCIPKIAKNFILIFDKDL